MSKTGSGTTLSRQSGSLGSGRAGIRDLTAKRVFPVWKYPRTSGNSTTDRKIAAFFAQDHWRTSSEKRWVITTKSIRLALHAGGILPSTFKHPGDRETRQQTSEVQFSAKGAWSSPDTSDPLSPSRRVLAVFLSSEPDCYKDPIGYSSAGKRCASSRGLLREGSTLSFPCDVRDTFLGVLE